MLDADNPMPLICDRCGVPISSGFHVLFDFQTWVDGCNRDEVPAGRLCMVCGDEVSEALVAFAHHYGLTHRAVLPHWIHDEHLGWGGQYAALGYRNE
jgi:hypothetical protein